MHRLFRTAAGVSAIVLMAALSASGVNGQEPTKKQPPAPPKVVKTTPTPAAQHVMVTPDKLQWGPAPPSLPAGAQAAVLDGDPSKAGLFVVRLKFPDGYTVPPHWHPTDEHAVVISGTIMMAMGSKIDEAAMHAMTAGSYAKLPRKSPHYVRAKGETIVQVTAMGPFQVTYVNANDDPRKKSN
jgi:quercetin dioxygenase-like cupin family protein